MIGSQPASSPTHHGQASAATGTAAVRTPSTRSANPSPGRGGSAALPRQRSMGTTSHSEDSYPTSSQPAHLPNSQMQTSSRSLKQPQPNRTAFPFSSHFRNPH